MSAALIWWSGTRCCMLMACRPASRDRPFLSDRYFFVTVRLLKERAELLDADFRLLGLAFNRARVMHPFFLTAWVFLPDPAAAGHAICAPARPPLCLTSRLPA